MSPQLPSFILGAVTMACFVAGLFFLRFGRESRDRLFYFFAAAFWMEGLNRGLLAFLYDPHEGSASLYLIRCVAYSLIVIGIWDKNRKG